MMKAKKMSNEQLVHMLAEERNMKAMGLFLDQFDFDNCQEAKPVLYKLQYVVNNRYSSMLTIEHRAKLYCLLNQLGGDYEIMWSPDWQKYSIVQRSAIIKAGGATDWFADDYIDKAIKLISTCLTNAKEAYLSARRFDLFAFVKGSKCTPSEAYNRSAKGTLEGEIAAACVYACNLAGYRNTMMGRRAWSKVDNKDVEYVLDESVRRIEERGFFLTSSLNCILYACSEISRRMNFDLELFVELHIKNNGLLPPNLEIRQWTGKRHKNRMIWD